jgi:hypothetical protein
MAVLTTPEEVVQRVFPDADLSTCPFTEAELKELEQTDEMLVYLPAKLTVQDLCALCDVRCNVALENENLIRNVMTDESHWFIASASARPEFLYQSATNSRRIYEDEGLHGMDLRRYLAFAATFQARNGVLPDQTYWTFLLSGRYDRSGVSVVGFDNYGVLSHHGWMRDFRAKFTGSRYIVLAPRIENTPETAELSRAYRGRRTLAGLEASTD